MKPGGFFAIPFLQVGLVSLALAQQTLFDLVIRGRRLLDGTGAPWIRADIAVRGDRIAAIGRLDGHRLAAALTLVIGSWPLGSLTCTVTPTPLCSWMAMPRAKFAKALRLR